MDEQLILTTLQKLIESGAFEKMNQPGAQSALIYALLILLAGMILKYVVLNGMVKRFFDLEELKVKELQTLNRKVVEIQENVKDDHKALKDVLGLLNAKREQDLR
ncbi:MAG: hypothetical protein RBT80_19180 [Candidatus Vecturithrix sp.]|jgi:hypothetical protein|nr:hypothetical protein [Candidatus Vecturithrix sp.]